MKIDRIAVSVYRAPCPQPVSTSFGTMRDRPAVFVQVFDGEGAFGWGEIFANWPSAGAEHRARLLMEDLSELILERRFDEPASLWRDLTRETHIRALQCGEWGPFRQVLAGLDTAIHDLFARRAGLPLAKALSTEAASAVPYYASGMQVSTAGERIARLRGDGVTAFKVKVGFDTKQDLSSLRKIAADLRDGERLFADANQAWDMNEAIHFLSESNDLGLGWMEEPLPADCPVDQWARLAAESNVALAAGENLTGEAEFMTAIRSGHFGYLQPDVAKWGGVTGCFEVANAILDGGVTYCPHFLGGGIGLLASAHLLAAAGGPGLLEVDANENPLRDAFLAEHTLSGGMFHLSKYPGLGIEKLPDRINQYRTLHLDSAC